MDEDGIGTLTAGDSNTTSAYGAFVLPPSLSTSLSILRVVPASAYLPLQATLGLCQSPVTGLTERLALAAPRAPSCSAPLVVSVSTTQQLAAQQVGCNDGCLKTALGLPASFNLSTDAFQVRKGERSRVLCGRPPALGCLVLPIKSSLPDPRPSAPKAHTAPTSPSPTPLCHRPPSWAVQMHCLSSRRR